MKTVDINQLIELAIQCNTPDLGEKIAAVLASVQRLGDGVSDALALETGTPFIRKSRLQMPIGAPGLEGIDLRRAANCPKTVIICDDDPLQRILARASLEGRGFCVLEAESAEACLEILEAGERVDLLILDIMLPGMSGLELLKVLQGRGAHFPSITISGVFPMEATEEESTTNGSIMHLSKPVNWSSFGQLAQEMVRVSIS